MTQSSYSLQPLREAVAQEMRAVLQAEQSPPIDHLHGMMHYHMGWVDRSFTPQVTNGGKQIRPLLLLLAAHATGATWTSAVPAAAAVELLHNFSLIHDDIEDRSPLRRGRDTCWHIWGIPLAINAGDAMFTAAHLAMNRLIERENGPDVVVRALRRFDETCLHLTQGQHLDMHFEERENVSVAEYIEMITGKTSVLLGLCAELGALIGGASEETIAHYASFGLNLGLAFQVIDDILGIWGDEVLIGKSASSDIETRKKTLPVLYGLQHSEELRILYFKKQNAPDFVPRVIDLLERCGAKGFAEEKAAAYTDLAHNSLSAAAPSGEAGQALQALTDRLLTRKH